MSDQHTHRDLQLSAWTDTVATFQAPSTSNPVLSHMLTVEHPGRIKDCTCPAGRMKNAPCWHQRVGLHAYHYHAAQQYYAKQPLDALIASAARAFERICEPSGCLEFTEKHFAYLEALGLQLLAAIGQTQEEEVA